MFLFVRFFNFSSLFSVLSLVFMSFKVTSCTFESKIVFFFISVWFVFSPYKEWYQFNQSFHFKCLSSSAIKGFYPPKIYIYQFFFNYKFKFCVVSLLFKHNRIHFMFIRFLVPCSINHILDKPVTKPESLRGFTQVAMPTEWAMEQRICPSVRAQTDLKYALWFTAASSSTFCRSTPRFTISLSPKHLPEAPPTNHLLLKVQFKKNEKRIS